MNILFLDQFSTIGGGQRSLLELLPMIMQRGWKARAAIPSEGTYSRQLRALGLPVDLIRCGAYTSWHKKALDVARYASETPQIARKILQIVKAHDITLLYVNGPRLLPAAALVARRLSIPLVFHSHHRLLPGAGLWLAGRALRWAHADVLACCSFAAEPLRPYVTEDRLRIVYNGVPEMPCSKKRRSNSPRRIGVIGRIEPEKGQMEFVAAARILKQEFADCHFLIAGAPLFSDDRYSQQVRAAAQDLPFHFLGWEQDISSVFASLDMLVVPSTPADSTPRVVIEAFSSGVPVVAFAAGGIPEIVADNQTGFLVSGASPAALATRIREVLQMDPRRLRETVCQANRKWRQRYTLARFQREVADVIAHVSSRTSVQNRAAAITATPAALARTTE